jgi:deoxyadenosine/deoxycytidine kinase
VRTNDIVDLEGIVYVQCDPQTCQQRIKKRDRKGEDDIPLDYLERIHEKHEEWLNSGKENDNGKILIIDNTVSLDK